MAIFNSYVKLPEGKHILPVIIMLIDGDLLNYN